MLDDDLKSIELKQLLIPADIKEDGPDSSENEFNSANDNSDTDPSDYLDEPEGNPQLSAPADERGEEEYIVKSARELLDELENQFNSLTKRNRAIKFSVILLMIIGEVISFHLSGVLKDKTKARNNYIDLVNNNCLTNSTIAAVNDSNLDYFCDYNSSSFNYSTNLNATTLNYCISSFSSLLANDGCGDINKKVLAIILISAALFGIGLLMTGNEIAENTGYLSTNPKFDFITKKNPVLAKNITKKFQNQSIRHGYSIFKVDQNTRLNTLKLELSKLCGDGNDHDVRLLLRI